MISEDRPLVEVTQEAIGILCREIGIVNTIRFLNQFTTGYGNYTEERELLFGQMSVDDIVSQIRQERPRTLEGGAGRSGT